MMRWIQLTSAREKHVTLVLRLSDILTGETIIGGRDLTVVSGDGLLTPVVKPDGYFVFTDYRPQSVRVRSKKYHHADFTVGGHTEGVLRFALIPRIAGERVVTIPEDAYIGFDTNGYALAAALSESSMRVHLHKADFRDITGLYHAIVASDGATEAIYMAKSIGDGQYALAAPPQKGYPVRGTHIVALHRTQGGRIPIPPKANTAYIMSDGVITTKCLEE